MANTINAAACCNSSTVNGLFPDLVQLFRKRCGVFFQWMTNSLGSVQTLYYFQRQLPLLFLSRLETKHPEYSIFFRSATGVDSGQIVSASFGAGRLSPVREDSSALRSLLSNSLASATILSPVSTNRISPTTISFCGSAEVHHLVMPLPVYLH